MAILRNGRKPLTRAPWRGGKSLAVELPGVEFGGARQCPGGRNRCQEWSSEGRVSAPEDETKASERSFSGANWL